MIIGLEIWFFCILVILAIIGFVVVCRFIWIEALNLLDIIRNYKRYKEFYYDNSDTSFKKFLDDRSKKEKNAINE